MQPQVAVETGHELDEDPSASGLWECDIAFPPQVKIDTLNLHRGRGLQTPTALLLVWGCLVERIRRRELSAEQQLFLGSAADQMVKRAVANRAEVKMAFCESGDLVHFA